MRKVKFGGKVSYLPLNPITDLLPNLVENEICGNRSLFDFLLTDRIDEAGQKTEVGLPPLRLLQYAS